MLKLSVKDLLQTIKPDLLSFSHKLQKKAIDIVEEEGLVYRGRLRRSIQTKLILDDDNPRIELFVYDSGEGEHKYAQYLHEGIKPHMPPIAPIKKWVHTKGLHKNDFQNAWDKAKVRNKERKKGQPKVSAIELTDRIVTSIAWAIAINMKNKGKEAVPFLELAIKMTINDHK